MINEEGLSELKKKLKNNIGCATKMLFTISLLLDVINSPIMNGQTAANSSAKILETVVTMQRKYHGMIKKLGTCSRNYKNKKEHLFPRLNDTSDLLLRCVGCVPVIGADSGICV